jgi:hypothetical protein
MNTYVMIFLLQVVLKKGIKFTREGITYVWLPFRDSPG